MRSVAEDEFLIGHNETLTLLRWWSLNSVSRDRILPKHDAANHVLAVQRAGGVLPRTFQERPKGQPCRTEARLLNRRQSFGARGVVPIKTNQFSDVVEPFHFFADGLA